MSKPSHFFSSLSGDLEIELSEAPTRVAGLENERASSTATIRSISLQVSVYGQDEEIRALTEAEWESVAFPAPSILLVGQAGLAVAHEAPNGGAAFTVRELVKAVEETERRTRGSTRWLGGVDVHHVFFEGLDEREEGMWAIRWGS